MDARQLQKQVAFLLSRATWADTPQALVLTGGAVVSRDGAGNFLPRPSFTADGPASLSLPYALVHLAGWDRDSFPGRVRRATIRVTVVAGGGGVAGATGSTTTNDTHGMATLGGGTLDPTQGIGKSLGKALDAVVDRLIVSALGEGNLDDATHAIDGSVGDSDDGRHGGMEGLTHVDAGQVCSRTFDIFVENATSSRVDHEAQLFRGTASAGQIALAWSEPPARFDSISSTTAPILRFSTTSAPTSTTDGTGITLTAGATSYTHTSLSAATTYYYSLFYPYDDQGTTRWSPRATAYATTP